MVRKFDLNHFKFANGYQCIEIKNHEPHFYDIVVHNQHGEFFKIVRNISRQQANLFLKDINELPGEEEMVNYQDFMVVNRPVLLVKDGRWFYKGLDFWISL